MDFNLVLVLQLLGVYVLDLRRELNEIRAGIVVVVLKSFLLFRGLHLLLKKFLLFLISLLLGGGFCSL